MTEIEKNIEHGKIRLHPVARAILQGVYMMKKAHFPCFLVYNIYYKGSGGTMLYHHFGNCI